MPIRTVGVRNKSEMLFNGAFFRCQRLKSGADPRIGAMAWNVQNVTDFNPKLFSIQERAG